MVRRHGRTGSIGWAVIATLATAGALLAACGGSSSSATTTTAGGSSTSTTSGGGTSQLRSFGGTIRSAKNATFKAVYTSTSTGGTTQTITLEQSPPKQVFSTTDSSGTVSTLLNTGATTYACTTESGGTATCTSMGSVVGAGALSALIGVYDGSAALTAIEGWQTIVASHLTGVSLTFTNTTIAGQPVRCANWKYHGSSAVYCVTDKGVLAKVVSSDTSGSTSTSSFELTSFTTSPPASDFELPAGATVVTVPSGA
jgi:hypothetical protein